MPLTAGLRKILKPDVVSLVAEDDSIELRESPADMRVKITGLPGTFIVIRTERVGHASKIRDGSWKRICDYLLVVELGDRTHAVFLELKKTQTQDNKPKEQLRRSLPLLNYLRSVWEIESRVPLDEHGMSVHYSILFEQTKSKLPKQPVKADPTRREKVEEYKGITIRTFIGTSVPFADLVAATNAG